MQIQALPRVAVRCILWRGAEGFGPHLTVTFDACVKDHLPLDVIWLLVHFVSERLARHGEDEEASAPLPGLETAAATDR